MNTLNPATRLPDTTLVEQAIKSTVSSVGAPALSAKLVKSPNVLNNEVNPSQPGHKLGLFDTIAIMHITRDYRILDALADGRITREEFHKIRKEGMEQIKRFFEFQARLEAVIDDD